VEFFLLNNEVRGALYSSFATSRNYFVNFMISTFAVCSAGLCPAYGASELQKGIDFLLHNDRLYLVGLDEDTTRAECNKLRDYAKMYSLRNDKVPKIIPECRLEKNPSEILDRGSHPSYTYGEARKMYLLRPLLKVAFEASDIVPKSIWKSTRKDENRDGVCYNSALVDSGLLSDSERSNFLGAVNYFVGFYSFVPIKTKDGERLGYGKLSDSPAVEKRFAFEVNEATRDAVKDKIDGLLTENFSPGDILCIDAMPMERLPKAISVLKLPETFFDPSLLKLQDDESRYVEYAGGHCLTFITSNLVADSNLLAPYNLANWDSVFSTYANMLKRWKTTGTFFYFKLQANRLPFRRWYDSQVAGDPRLRALLGLLKEHRVVFETFGSSFGSCYWTCALGGGTESSPKLREFWVKEAIPLLKGDLFNEFWEIPEARGHFLSGPKRLAYQIFRGVVHAGESLGFLNKNSKD